MIGVRFVWSIARRTLPLLFDTLDDTVALIKFDKGASGPLNDTFTTGELPLPGTCPLLS